MKENIPAGIQEVLGELVGRKNAFLASLDGLPVEKFIIGNKELSQIRAATELVRFFVERYERESGMVKKEDRPRYDKRKTEELIRQLDALDVWSAKFATERSGGASSDIPLQEYDSDTDSLYYMTPSGATMRIKTASLIKGLRRAVQPFTEKIVFEGPSGEISESPQEGYKVVEHWSDQFRKAVTGGNNGVYQPGLEIYRKENSIAAISHKDDRGNTSFSPAHEGDRVNKIFFLR